MGDINIKSSTVEKGLEVLKEFLGRLLGPAFDEIGELAADRIRFVRFKYQLNILTKAKKHIEQRNIKINPLPLKILAPLLEAASLEDNEDMQDKWAIMLANMVDSETNLQNQIFPFILGQISLSEFTALRKLHDDETEFQVDWEKYRGLQNEFDPEAQKSLIKLNNIRQGGHWLRCEDYERENLIRLGLVKETSPSIKIEEIIDPPSVYNGGELMKDLVAKYDPDDVGWRITKLGERFLEVCMLNDKK